MADAIEAAVLARLADGEIGDTGDLAAALGVDHLRVVGVLKSLEAAEMIAMQDISHSRYVLTPEAESYLTDGSPEVQLLAAIPQDGIALAELKASLPPAVSDVGFKQAMQQRWVALDKGAGEPRVVRKAGDVPDATRALLADVAAGRELAKADAEALQKKRKLIKLDTWKTYRVARGPQFATERRRQATELTSDMLSSGAWRGVEFKAYNFNALGRPPAGGHLHPLLKVRSQYRKIFTSMGFTEMPTNNYVESSFWNFDSLFQPQQHPARDAHDTFFLTAPAASDTFPEDYLERVKAVHEHGGHGSAGYGYCWKRREAQKNLLRTHTTAVSSRMLYQLAQEGFRPAKLFSIDRVFRNEAVDRTHLAEFHQVEGLICDRGLTLGHLIATLQEFFSRLGMKELRFKPAFNPYTEPSMEIFGYSPELGKWMEVGNSGMFRPEMLSPMGLPPDVNVIAWGLSLERPTMILYGIDNIRDLFGHKVSLSMVKANPICRMGL
ncbi:Phenylalanine--tRNA ligase alpha subunit [Scenedesmus sp. PABB004]|nr:Phenylalanine--tRNA ligase alpha subunit [Scenedesmus sp. PABB004]